MIIKTHFKTKFLISKKFISGKIYIRPKKKYMSVYGYILKNNRHKFFLLYDRNNFFFRYYSKHLQTGEQSNIF